MPTTIDQEPGFELELNLGAGQGRFIAGIDEVGRGPLAGPVTAAAVIFQHGEFPVGLDDSKKLTPARREGLFRLIMDHAIVSLAHVDVSTIDRINILEATLMAMRQACLGLSIVPDHALIDGNRIPAGLPCPATTHVSGDRKSVSIAAASIVAKVERDRIMSRLDRQYPAYGWAANKGYGTRVHLKALHNHGITPHHRMSFAPVRAAMNNH